jgi:hypothetical protein
MRTLLFIVTLAVISSCASNKVVQRAKGPNAQATESGASSSKQKPQWLMDLDEGCPPTQLCAVGEASGHMLADAEARKAIGRIFETRVKSNTKINTTASSTSSADTTISGKNEEDFSQTIEELSDEILKGVEIKSKWEDTKTGTVYALATLTKAPAAERFKAQMDEFDEKIVDLNQDGKRASLNKALRLLEARNKLNERYQVLSRNRYPEKVTQAQLLAKKRAKAKEAVKVSLDMEQLGDAKELRSLVTQLLLDNDYQVIGSGGSFKVEGSLEREDLHINVQGFEKHKFILKLRSLNAQGDKVGAIQHVEEQVGRSQIHALGNAMPGMRKFLNENLGELNMD